MTPVLNETTTTTFAESSVLQIGDSSFTASGLTSLLVKYQMLPALVREVVIDQAIATIECSPAEHRQAIEKFYVANQITAEPQLKAWLSEGGMSVEQLEALVLRQLKLNKFKQSWLPKVESYFLKRKAQIDQVTYSLLQTQDAELAQELYFRIRDDGQSFAELARQYPDVTQFQFISRVEIEKHPLAAQVLKKYQLRQPCAPIFVNNWFTIAQIEQIFPAQLDERMRQRLVDELFNQWLQAQIPQTVIKMRR